jgi:hypothetical protein
MRVLGYDARIPRGVLASEWDGERRHRFLLKPDANVPLSVDTMIWPSMVMRAGGVPQGPDRNYESSLASRPEEVRAAVRGQQAEIVAITEGDEALSHDDWILLGWDIADQWLLSGIANCGKEAEEWRPIRKRWVDEVNEHNLFSDYGSADECRAEVDKLVPEHAPFRVYGLWLWAP